MFSNSLIRSTEIEVVYPFTMEYIEITCSSTDKGLYCPCFSASVSLRPRSISCCVLASNSPPN